MPSRAVGYVRPCHRGVGVLEMLSSKFKVSALNLKSTMDIERFRDSPIGRLEPVKVADGEVIHDHFAFVPHPLPGDLQLSQATWRSVTRASAALARLDGAARRLPNPYLLVRPALTKEAVASSALEGTFAPVEDVLQADFLADEDLSDQTVEVRNYVRASERGFELLKELPICLRLVREVHGTLMQGARGDYAEAGRFRRTQNWIGERRSDPITRALFVPPPPGEILDDCLAVWERWVNEESGMPDLLKVALGHYQFETIHPFVDGNGRVGRMVAVLTFIASGELRVPLLNISPFLEEHRDEYVDHLRTVSATGDFEPWIVFFADAVRVQSERALEKAERLVATRDEMMNSLHSARVRGTALRIAEDLVGFPIVTATDAANRYDVSFQAANTAIGRLVEAKILRQVTRGGYARLFSAPSIVSIISE